MFDDFHYGDESGSYVLGTYASYEEALSKARSIVEAFITDTYKPGMQPEDLSSQFALYGEDPAIIPLGPSLYPHFSAREYAHQFAATYYQ